MGFTVKKGSEKGSQKGVSRRCLELGFPRPQTGPKTHFLEKRVSGSKNPHFPSWKREFSVKKSPFFYKGTQGKWGFFDRKLPFPGRVRARGNGGFWTPKPSFPLNGDSGPCLGSGESQA